MNLFLMFFLHIPILSLFFVLCIKILQERSPLSFSGKGLTRKHQSVLGIHMGGPIKCDLWTA